MVPTDFSREKGSASFLSLHSKLNFFLMFKGVVQYNS